MANPQLYVRPCTEWMCYNMAFHLTYLGCVLQIRNMQTLDGLSSETRYALLHRDPNLKHWGALRFTSTGTPVSLGGTEVQYRDPNLKHWGALRSTSTGAPVSLGGTKVHQYRDPNLKHWGH